MTSKLIYSERDMNTPPTPTCPERSRGKAEAAASAGAACCGDFFIIKEVPADICSFPDK